MFTKEQMLEELHGFLYTFAQDVEFWFGKCGGTLIGHPEEKLGRVGEDEADFSLTPIWGELGYLYDYGVLGHKGHSGSTPFSGPCSWTVQDHLQRLPALVLRTIVLADARNALDGNPRERRVSDVPNGHLSLGEVAVFANVDEQSVRNAARQKGPEGLPTKEDGGRSMVTVKEARRWLAGHEGFKPTCARSPAPSPAQEQSPIGAEATRRLQSLAQSRGVSVDALVGQLVGP